MPDTASHSSPQLDSGEVRHTLSVNEVASALAAAGVSRSHRSVIRYCETAMLDAVKVHGPTGEQWFVSPSSLPKAIGDLKQWEAQRARQSSPQQDVSSSVALEKDRNKNPDTASHSTPQPAMAEKETSQKGSETESVMASYGSPELDIFEHPYVKKLEDRVDKLEAKYEAQVRRTEEIQLKGQAQLLELQRMTAVGQSQTLADFMLKARNLVFGATPEHDDKQVDPPSATL